MDVLRSFPKVGVEAALCMVMEEMDDVLSARARGAKGGGLPEIGGLKERDWNPDKTTPVIITVIKTTALRMTTGDDSRHSKPDNQHFYQICEGFPRRQFWSRGWPRGRRWRDGTAPRLRCGSPRWR